MTNTVFGRLFYLNNYGYFSNNTYLKDKLPSYIDYVLYSKDDSYIQYITNLKEEYNYNNYMCILENIINYIIKIFNLTFQDYLANKDDKNIAQVLQNLMNRYYKLLNIYNIEFDNQLAQEEKKEEKKVYRKTKYKKHYVYKTVNNQTKR